MKTGAFLGWYLFLMVLTYLCRWVVIAALPEDSSTILWLPSAVLAVIYVAMCRITYKRSKTIEKSWLITFPLVGAIFDVSLVFIPLVPTVMNILGLVFGMITPKKEG